MNIVSKQEAQDKGQIFYFTGKPCKHGHISERMVKGGTCRECKKIVSENYRNNNREEYNEYCRIKKKESYSPEKRKEEYRKNLQKELFYAAKTRAKNKKITFTITIEDVIIPLNCPVFEIPLDHRDRQHAPTLDRINNNLGYVPNNIKVISAKANRLKNNGSIEDFEKILRYMKNA